MKPITDWFTRNWGGMLASCIIAVFFYALTAWLKNTVMAEMKNYVPLPTWTQWAQERGEWRGEVEARVTALEKGQTALRFEIIDRLEKVSADLKVLQALFTEHTRQTAQPQNRTLYAPFGIATNSLFGPINPELLPRIARGPDEIVQIGGIQ